MRAPMHPILNIAIKAARRAGSIINRAAFDGTALEVRTKQAKDFVTQVDRAAEAEVIAIIRKAYPDHAILAEESGAHLGNASGVSRGKPSEYRWIIDPLDGTTNFIHGFPQYCVSIGVQHRGALAHAVVYDPQKNELFTASQGRGAFLNDRRIRATRCTQLGDALVATGFPFKELARLDRYMAQLRTVMESAAGVRRAGSAALDLAYVAAGRVDAFWELGLSPWDIAAGALLVQEAGGLVMGMSGDADFLESGDVIATAPKIMEPLRELLRGASAL
jgi:myo-inositol-1(or 4)-monophosphatase